MAWWLGGFIGLGCSIPVFLVLILFILLLSLIFNRSVQARQAKLEKKNSAPKSLKDIMEDKVLIRRDPFACIDKHAQREYEKLLAEKKIADIAARRYRFITGVYRLVKKCFILFLIAGFIVGAVLAGR